MKHSHLFAFEQDFVASLRRISMAVRYKLDRMDLASWDQVDAAEHGFTVLARKGEACVASSFN